jgi:hypothetical protein
VSQSSALEEPLQMFAPTDRDEECRGQRQTAFGARSMH